MAIRIAIVLLTAYFASCTLGLVFVPLFADVFHDLLHPTAADEVVALGVWVGIATMLLVSCQIVIAIIELRVVRNQDRIMRTQDELLNRRGKLVIWSKYRRAKDCSSVNPNRIWLETFVCNIGQRTVRDFIVRLAIPRGKVALSANGWDADAEALLEERPYATSRKVLTGLLLYPNVPLAIDSLVLDIESGLCEFDGVCWQLVYEDGVMPNLGEWWDLDAYDQLPEEWRPDGGRMVSDP